MHLEPITQSKVSQEKKKLMCINAYMWNLEKRYWWIYLQDRNRDADLEINVIFLEVSFHFLLEGKAGYTPIPKRNPQEKFFNHHI